MNLGKRVPYRNPRLLAAANGRPCVRCQFHKGVISVATTVRAHYTGPFQHALGKGGGQKADDHSAWDACYICHKEADDPSVVWPEGDKSELQLLYILLTLRRDLMEGVLK